MKKGVSGLVIGIVIAVVLIVVIVITFIFINKSPTNLENNSTYFNQYWDQTVVTQYLVEHYTNLSFRKTGNGNLGYYIGDKEYIIKCQQKQTSPHTVSNCCKEGEIEYEVKYDDKKIIWKNVIYQDECYSE